MSVGFTPADSVEELRRVYEAVSKLRKSLRNARKSLDSRSLKLIIHHVQGTKATITPQRIGHEVRRPTHACVAVFKE